MNSFRNLNTYIKAKELVSQVYALIKKFPKEEFQHLETLIDVEAKLLTGLVNKRNNSAASI